MTCAGIETATLRVVTQRFKQMSYDVAVNEKLRQLFAFSSKIVVYCLLLFSRLNITIKSDSLPCTSLSVVFINLVKAHVIGLLHCGKV